MRITNKMMNYDTLSNMNANKTTLDKLNSRMSTEKKIARLSDDPVVGIRALRLRGSLSEITQYYGANVPDAVAWVDVTQKAIDSTTGILSSMKSLLVQGANGTYDAASRTKIYEELKADVRQIYQNGNADYAGRTVFTGYRTGESLTFKEDTTADYRGIKDTFNASDIMTESYVESPFSMDDINTISVAPGESETSVKEDRVNRIRLSYDNLNTKVKSDALPGRYNGEEAGALSGWDPSDWDIYVKDGKIINPGASLASGVTVGSGTVNLRLNDKCDQSLLWEPDIPDVVEMVGTLKEGYDYVGDRSRCGKIFTTRLKDTTTLTYRTPLEKTASVDPESIKTDPVEGLQSFKLKYDGETYNLKKLDGIENDGKWWAVDDTGACIMRIEVTQNTDGSFCIKVPTNPAYPSSTGGIVEYNVFNIGEYGATVTSAYHETNLEVEIKTSTDTVATSGGKDLTAYQYLALDPNDKNSSPATANAIYLLADTGELVFGSSVAETLRGLKDIPGVDTISVSYDKSSFKEGDLRPEHMLDCKVIDGDHNILDPLLFDDQEQEINYTVGTDQKIKINTNAKDIFDTQIIRQVDDILTAIEGCDEAEDKVNRLKSMQEQASSYSVEEMEKLSTLLDAANKELDIAKNKLQSVYETAIEAFTQFHYNATLAGSACGTVNERLQLINNRLMEEQSTVKVLASENENVDITHVAIEVSDAEQIYNSALMATGKISQHSLLNYL